MTLPPHVEPAHRRRGRQIYCIDHLLSIFVGGGLSICLDSRNASQTPCRFRTIGDAQSTPPFADNRFPSLSRLRIDWSRHALAATSCDDRQAVCARAMHAMRRWFDHARVKRRDVQASTSHPSGSGSPAALRQGNTAVLPIHLDSDCTWDPSFSVLTTNRPASFGPARDIRIDHTGDEHTNVSGERKIGVQDYISLTYRCFA